MSIDTITYPTTRVRLAELSARTDTFAAAVAKAKAPLDDCDERRDELRSQQARNAGRPQLSAFARSAEMLSADPSLAETDGAVFALEYAQPLNHAKGELLAAALEAIEVERRPLMDAYRCAQSEHEAAWREFVCEARQAMFHELELKFPQFYLDVMGPLDALLGARKIYAPEIVGNRPDDRTLDPAAKLAIRWANHNGPNATGIRLYPPAVGSAPEAVAAQSVMLAEFRASLEVVAAPRRRAAGR